MNGNKSARPNIACCHTWKAVATVLLEVPRPWDTSLDIKLFFRTDEQACHTTCVQLNPWTLQIVLSEHCN